MHGQWCLSRNTRVAWGTLVYATMYTSTAVKALCIRPTAVSERIFDENINRFGTSSLKWDRYADDVIPLWVADMDFKAPSCVLNALRQRVDHGVRRVLAMKRGIHYDSKVFGYTDPDPQALAAVLHYLKTQYNWSVPSESIVWLPGIVQGLNIACRMIYKDRGAGQVIVFPPIYPPFFSAPEFNGLTTLRAPLSVTKDGWTHPWQFLADMLRKSEKTTHMMMVCSPHNPSGHVYSRDELNRLLNTCSTHGLVCLSDEIHCDLVLGPIASTSTGSNHRPHVPMGKVAQDEGLEHVCITMMSPSKTYNLAGIACAFAIIPDAKLRSGLIAASSMLTTHIFYLNEYRGFVQQMSPLSYTAVQAAYSAQAEEWRLQLLQYLTQNRAMVYEAVQQLKREGLPVKMTPSEATYLAWIDATQISTEHSRLYSHFLAHKIALSDGRAFGAPGFVRLNFACPQSTLADGLLRFQKGVRDLVQ